MANSFDIREYMDCSCFRLRRAAREATRLYDRHLEPIGLGANQVTLLATVYGIETKSGSPATMPALAAYVGADPTTMSRNLKPLAKLGLLTIRPDPADRRARIVAISAKGRAKLNEAAPHRRRAEAEMKKTLGDQPLRALHRLLDRSAALLVG